MKTRRPLVPVGYLVELGLGTPSHIYELAKGDIVPSVRVGRRVLFDPDKIDEFIDSGGRALPGGWRRRKPVDERRSA